jgi:hypothetical protein
VFFLRVGVHRGRPAGRWLRRMNCCIVHYDYKMVHYMCCVALFCTQVHCILFVHFPVSELSCILDKLWLARQRYIVRYFVIMVSYSNQSISICIRKTHKRIRKCESNSDLFTSVFRRPCTRLVLSFNTQPPCRGHQFPRGVISNFFETVIGKNGRKILFPEGLKCKNHFQRGYKSLSEGSIT